ncbi:MAG TPA: hypothetical protein VI454_13985 [Verrucomicrobiae bacterium]|jgi:hypothetical protein
MSTEFPDVTLELIKADLRAGRKIAAIKHLKEGVPGIGLAEAKAAIENLHAELHAKEPNAYPAPAAGGKGCFVVLVLLIVGAAVFGLLVRR